MVAAENPEYFVSDLRTLFSRRPFEGLVHKPEFDMLGRTYSIGYEQDLEETLFKRPLSKMLDAEEHLGRSGIRSSAPRSSTRCRRSISARSSRSMARSRTATRAMRTTSASRATASTRTITTSSSGLVGAQLHPLSAIVQEMRKTEQTSQYLDSLGPFFVGRAIWQSAG